MKKRILIIEDDIDLAGITRDMLESYGYGTEIVTDCGQAFDILVKERFQLVLMDINLPDGSGFDVCRELRHMSRVPVILPVPEQVKTIRLKGWIWAAMIILPNRIRCGSCLPGSMR